MLFPSLRPVSRTIPVTRHLPNPDHFAVQLFSMKEQFIRKNMPSFPPIRAQGKSFEKFKIVLLDVRADKNCPPRRNLAFFGKCPVVVDEKIISPAVSSSSFSEAR